MVGLNTTAWRNTERINVNYTHKRPSGSRKEGYPPWIWKGIFLVRIRYNCTSFLCQKTWWIGGLNKIEVYFLFYVSEVRGRKSRPGIAIPKFCDSGSFCPAAPSTLACCLMVQGGCARSNHHICIHVSRKEDRKRKGSSSSKNTFGNLYTTLPMH